VQFFGQEWFWGVLLKIYYPLLIYVPNKQVINVTEIKYKYYTNR
jgi:hypothetical protein